MQAGHDRADCVLPLHEPSYLRGLILIDLMMTSLLQQRRSMHQGDDIFGWGYRLRDQAVSSPPLFHTSDDGGSDMDLDDGFSGVFEEIADV